MARARTWSNRYLMDVEETSSWTCRKIKPINPGNRHYLMDMDSLISCQLLFTCARDTQININPKSVKEEPQDDRKFQFIIKSG